MAPYPSATPVSKLSVTVRGRSLTTLARRGWQMVLELSTICRFFLITLKDFPQQCQQGVGKWSIIGKTWSTYLKNGPSGRKVTQDGWVRMRNVNGPRRLSLQVSPLCIILLYSSRVMRRKSPFASADRNEIIPAEKL